MVSIRSLYSNSIELWIGHDANSGQPAEISFQIWVTALQTRTRLAGRRRVVKIGPRDNTQSGRKSPVEILPPGQRSRQTGGSVSGTTQAISYENNTCT